MEQRCPVCALDCRAPKQVRDDVYLYDCPRCREFEISWEEGLERGAERDPLLAHFLRERFERTGLAYSVDDRGTGRFPRQFVEFSVPEKLNLALLCVADRSPGFGKASRCDPDTDWPLAQAAGPDEFVEMLRHWSDEGALVNAPHHLPGVFIANSLRLTGKGWALAEEIRPTRRIGGHQAFVAMSFSDEMKPAFEKAIEPALRQCGWSAYRVDHDAFEGKVCDKVVLEIRRSSLVVVECTGMRPDVYFEAGFAMGLGIPVVWCVRRDALEEDGIAFDTRQYAHLPWSDEAELRTSLADRVRALHSRA